jgi:hypothetical protein
VRVRVRVRVLVLVLVLVLLLDLSPAPAASREARVKGPSLTARAPSAFGDPTLTSRASHPGKNAPHSSQRMYLAYYNHPLPVCAILDSAHYIL